MQIIKVHKETLQIQNELLPLLSQVGYNDNNRIAKEIADHLQETLGPDNTKWEKELEAIKSRLLSNEPWEYIRGWAEFRGQRLSVNPDVLIPRLETEVLVQEALAIIQDLVASGKTVQVVDVGTGSGAIATSLAKELPNIQIIATDTSKKALGIARNNAEGSNVTFVETDLIDGLELSSTNHKVIIANLPYIPTKDYLELDSSVLNYEPKLALDGGEDGLALIRRLIEQIKQIPGERTLLLEFDPSTTKNLQEYLQGQDLEYSLFKDQFERERFTTVVF